MCCSLGGNVGDRGVCCAVEHECLLQFLKGRGVCFFEMDKGCFLLL